MDILVVERSLITLSQRADELIVSMQKLMTIKLAPALTTEP
jgi:hypothetical protein